MNLCLVIVHARGIAVVLDDVDNQSRHGVESVEGEVVFPSRHALGITVDAGLCANTEEERGNIFDFQDALLRQLSDERNKALLW